MFLATERRNWQQFGRILVGIGLLILSLQMIGQSSEPLRDSQLLPVIVAYFSSDPVTAYLLAALITWLFHSSIAAVLLLVALAGRGFIPPELGIVLVLGVNLGSSVIAPLLTRRAEPGVRVVPIGNLLMRGVGSLVMLILFLWLEAAASASSAPAKPTRSSTRTSSSTASSCLPGCRSPDRSIVCPRRSWRWARRPSRPTRWPIAELSALDETALDTPAQALANATREVVRVCETVEIMLKRIFELYEAADADKIKALAALDDRVDRQHAAIKLYLAKVTIRQLSEAEALRCQELIGACVKLEQVGDIIVRNMLAHVQKKFDRGLEFTDEGWRELAAFHASVTGQCQARLQRADLARPRDRAACWCAKRTGCATCEKQTSQSHFVRLRDGTAKSVETSSIHLDTIRDLKQINSLLASMAYPVLEERGLLTGSTAEGGVAPQPIRTRRSISLDALDAGQRHRHVEFLADDLDRPGDAGLAAGAQAVDIGAADQAAFGAERQRAHHVLAGADAAVEQDLDLRAHRVGDARAASRSTTARRRAGGRHDWRRRSPPRRSWRRAWRRRRRECP